MEQGLDRMRQGLKLTWMVLACGMLALALVGCGQDGATEEPAEPSEPPPSVVDEVVEPEAPAAMAQAVLQPSATHEGMSGTITFTEAEGAVTVVAHLEGAPAGARGFHIHEVGDCSASDFTSAGGHFNPGAVDHAGPNDPVRHGGDLGNIEVAEDGTAHLEVSSSQITLGDGEHSIMGRAVIVHKGEDDLTSQPTGAAGARIACGIIEAVSPDTGEAPADDAAADEQAAH